MNATVEIDKAGRLVVPKKMRDALHLHAGDRLEVACCDNKLVFEPERTSRGLYMKDGWPVFDSGGPPITPEDVNRWIAEDREARMIQVSGMEWKR